MSDYKNQYSYVPEWNSALYQIQQKERMIQNSSSLIFVLSEPMWSSVMEEDMMQASKLGKKIYHVSDLSDESLKFDVEKEQMGILFYGEAGLFLCKDLKAPAIVHLVPTMYEAKALTNQFGKKSACMVYVPENWNIHPYVSRTAKTKISYWQLARLWETYGDSIYTMTLDELYVKYPQYFLNIYANGSFCREAEEDYPIHISMEDVTPEHDDVYEMFCIKREKAISDFINRSESFRYFSSYFDEELNQTSIMWQETETPGILVHGVKIKRAEKSNVLDIRHKGTVRQILEGEKEVGLKIVSNFLFFFTAKLTEANLLRRWMQGLFYKWWMDYCEILGYRATT